MTDVFGHPEESIAVYEKGDTLALDTPDSIDELVAEGQFAYAYELMRLRLAKEAIRALRLSGCDFAGGDARMTSHRNLETIDSEKPAALYLANAERFWSELDAPSADQISAMTALQLLDWQRRTLKAAASQQEAGTLMQMALFSASIGYAAGTSGVGGVVPDARKMRQIVRHAAKVKKKRGEGGVKAASIKTDKWHRWAYDQALDQRARFPTRSRTGIANAIHEKDVQGGSPIIPSWDSLYDTLADWEKGKRLPEGFGTLAKKSV